MKVALALLLIVPCCLAKNFGGINVEGVGQVYVVGSDWNSDFVQVSSNELRLNGGGRIYFAKDASDGVYPELYWQVSLRLEPVYCKKQQKKFLTSYWFVE